MVNEFEAKPTFCFTRRTHNAFFDFKNRLKTDKFLRISGYVLFAIAVILAALWFFGFTKSTAIFVIAIFVVFLGDVLFGVAYFIPAILFYTLYWVGVSIASILDMVTFTKYLAQLQNRIALKILGINLTITAVFWLLNTALA